MLGDTESDKLLMIPGPTPVSSEILTAMSGRTIAHTSGVLAETIRHCQSNLARIAGAKRGQVFVFAGSGTLAQEAAVVNLVAPGETLLVISNGFFGDRFASIAHAHGIEVDRLAAPWGETVTADQLRERLQSGPVAAITMTHVDTSTGTAAPCGELASVAREFGSLVILDSVCALGGMPVRMDEWGIDIVLAGAQKALGVPPGLAILVVSERAMARRRELSRVPTFYGDLLNWEASMRDPKTYFSTHAVNSFYALRAAVDIIQREGLEARFARHACLAPMFRAGMHALGFVPFTAGAYLAPTLSVLRYPEGVQDENFREELAQRGVIAAGCLGDFKGRGARFGHMGNITETEILQCLAAIESALSDVGHTVQPGAALVAAQRTYHGQPVPA